MALHCVPLSRHAHASVTRVCHGSEGPSGGWGGWVLGCDVGPVEALRSLVPVLLPACSPAVSSLSGSRARHQRLFNYAAIRTDQLTRQYGDNEGALHFSCVKTLDFQPAGEKKSQKFVNFAAFMILHILLPSRFMLPCINMMNQSLVSADEFTGTNGVNNKT